MVVAEMNNKKMQSRQQKSVTKTQKKIIDAARSVFTEKGLYAATVEDITDKADVGRGSFYYHFEDMQSLIQLMVERTLKELNDKMLERCSGKEDLNSTLDALIGAHIDFFKDKWDDFVLYLQGRADLTLDESFEGIKSPYIDYLVNIEKLLDGVIPEPISKPKLRRLACAIAGFISGYYSFASVSSRDDDVDQIFISLRSAFVNSLARFIKEMLPEDQTKSTKVK